MKRFGITIVLAAILIPAICAQASSRGTSQSGSAGLFSIPSGHIGWEQSANAGLDVGYHTIIHNEQAAHIPMMAISLFKWVEISSAFDIQPDSSDARRNDDLLLGLKVRLPTNINNPNNPAVALGGNVQLVNVDDTADDYTYNAFQFYAAATYTGMFFTMPAETTVVAGKTVYSGGPGNNSNIDFGMGFDIILFPDTIGNLAHWVMDFANFDYSDNSWPNNGAVHSQRAWYRGLLNTGIRFDLASIPQLSKYRFNVDIILNDLFDSGSRSFTLGAVFGMPLM